MADDNPSTLQLQQMSKPALAAEVLQLRGQMNALRGEILKGQIVGATRLDVIRLLGFMMNRDPAPDPLTVAPQTPEVRKIMARELRDLAAHLVERAEDFVRTAEKLEADDGAEESS